MIRYNIPSVGQDLKLERSCPHCNRSNGWIRNVAKDFEYMMDTEGTMVTSMPEERVVAVSSKVARELSEAYGLEREKMRITPGASRFPLSSKTNRRAKEGYVIGFVGGDVYTKGIALLAEVIDELHEYSYLIVRNHPDLLDMKKIQSLPALKLNR